MRSSRFLLITLSLVLLLATASAAPKKKKTVAKPHAAAAQTRARKTAKREAAPTTSRGRKAASSRRSGKAVARRGSSHRVRAAARPVAPAGPSADRYREIQEALIAKGYLKTPATGVWDQESIEALTRFQADQKLSTTGKLSSLSLIALGLGPKEQNGSAVPPAR